MRSLKRVFEKLKRGDPNWSDYTCFSYAISGKGFSKKIISRYFNKLVDKGDYQREEKKEVLERLFWLSQRTESRPEESRFLG
jgi:hypothetical protein